MLRKFVTLLVALLVTTGGFLAFDSGVAYAAPPPALPKAAPDADLKFQPAMDYDKDGCYPTSAIGPDGTTNPGLDLGGDLNGECRDESDLDNTNAYSRSKCNNDWCAFMYAFYFEKDQVSLEPGSAGHKHDWEDVVVWVHNNTPQWVAVSQHGNYDWRNRNDIPFEDTHAKVVYHKDGGSTHVFRHAGGDESPENHKGAWQFPPLVGWDDFPSGIQDKLVSADFGKASLKLKDGEFEKTLYYAKPSEVPLDPGWSPPKRTEEENPDLPPSHKIP
jgi:hypothetical protein